MILDDEKYNSLRNSLKSLPKIKAKSDFEARLFQRIEEAEKNPVIDKPVVVKEPQREGWLARLFRPSFVPALGLTVVLLVAVVVYYGYFSNMGGKDTNQQFSSGKEEQGGFVIYIKKDSESPSYSDNYPKEYSALETDEKSKERFMSPTEVPSDFLSRPERSIDKIEIVPDRLSEEQKIEMKRSSDIETKGTDSKSDRKGDDIILKKESKTEPKKKGELKSETEKAPYNIRDEKKNEYNNDDGLNNQQINPAPPTEGKEKVNDKTGTEEGQKKDSSIFGKTVKDSMKAKTKDIDVDQQNEPVDQK